MNLSRFGYVTFLVAVTVTLLVVTDAKKCKKNDKGDKSKCRRKKGKSSKSRNPRSQKTPAAPHWRKQRPPKDNVLVFRDGSDVTINCPIRGSPTPTFSWLRENRSLTVKKKSKKYRQKRTRLIVKSVEVSDTAQYTCIAKNELGVLNFTYSVKVLENMPLKDIEVVSPPRDQTAHPGDTVIFHCRSQDWPKPRVYWIRKTDSNNIIEVVSSKANNSEDLVLHKVSKTDSGVYTCSIGNGMVNKELSARLNVIDEDEKLPFEPPCSLHIRHDYIVDYKTGCRTTEPVEMYYCMGSCGRSYFVPQMVPTDVLAPGDGFNQTCSCCVGVFDALILIEMNCSLGTKKRAFFHKLRDCRCQECATKELGTKSDDAGQS